MSQLSGDCAICSSAVLQNKKKKIIKEHPLIPNFGIGK
jgi:hypothetical protein